MDKTIVIRGKLHWAKVTGPARPHTGLPKYNRGPSWSVDVTPDAASREILQKMGVSADKFRSAKGDKDKRTETFISLKVLENKKDGGKNKPPKITDIYGNAWDPEVEIGNESVGDVKVNFVDYGDTQGLYLKAIRVLKLIPYERNDDMPELDPDDEFFAAREDEEGENTPVIDKPSEALEDEVDDDVPF